ncbi:hypothetical protein MAFF301560_15360 [Ralstonia solanacearum]|nr:hypothetical protein MAFF301560_15360 [Ralstonia solanacearum]BEU47098.1 hypothetical protein MAFF211519_24230 [Ralstonia pseudosolanacearum]
MQALFRLAEPGLQRLEIETDHPIDAVDRLLRHSQPSFQLGAMQKAELLERHHDCLSMSSLRDCEPVAAARLDAIAARPSATASKARRFSVARAIAPWRDLLRLPDTGDGPLHQAGGGMRHAQRGRHTRCGTDAHTMATFACAAALVSPAACGACGG